MKKKMLFLLMIIGLFFSFSSFVLAEKEDVTCSAVDKGYIKQQAANIRVTFNPVMGEVKKKDAFGNESVRNELHQEIKLYNVTSNMFLEVSYSGKNVKKESFTVDYKNIGEDRAITINHPAIDEVTTYVILVYSDYNNCYGDLVRTIKLTVPRFNAYSQSVACNDISDYYLCNEFVTFDIDSATFFNNVDNYKKSLENMSENDPSIKDGSNGTQKTATAISKYKYVIVGLIVAGGVLATIYIIKRKKSEE